MLPCETIPPCINRLLNTQIICDRCTLFRQKLTHFLKILEIFKIPKFFGSFIKIPNFWSKHACPPISACKMVSLPNFAKISFSKCAKNLSMSILGPQNFGKMQSKIGTPKIDTPKIDVFFKIWAIWKCVNLWRRTVNRTINWLNK